MPKAEGSFHLHGQSQIYKKQVDNPFLGNMSSDAWG